MALRRLALGLFSAALTVTAAGAQNGDVTRYELDDADAFSLMRLNGEPVRNADVSVQDGVVRFDYARRGFPILVHAVALTGLQEMRVRVRAQRGADIVIGLEDRDGRSFSAQSTVQSDEWTTLVIRPKDFTSDDHDAPFDPERVGVGYGLVDVSSPVLQWGRGVIEIDWVEVETAPLPTLDGPLVVTADRVIADSVAILGDVEVGPGATLTLAGGRTAIAGDVTVGAGGALQVTGGTLALPSQFVHQRSWTLDGGRFAARGAALSVPFPVEVTADGTAAFILDDTITSGLFSVTAREGASVSLDGATGGGEFIMCPSCPFTAADAVGFVLWLPVFPDFGPAELAFPDGAFVESWSPGAPWSVAITNAREAMWGLITAPGADVVVPNSELIAIASVWGGPGETTVRGVRTGELPEGAVFAPGDRRVALPGSSVNAWNFYTTQGHDLTIEDSTVGEVWALDGTGAITIRGSVVDGSGGTLRARGETVMVVEDTTVLPQVIAQDRVRMTFRGSRIQNQLSVVDQAVVTLIDTPVTGRTLVEPTAQVVVPDAP